jgi:sugar (pentulose or hexulose) kinase
MINSTIVAQESALSAFCADIGTSSIKAALISVNGTVFASTRIHFDERLGSNRWLFALKEAALQLFKTTTSTLCAISISGNGPSLVNSNFSYLWNEPLSANVLQKLDKAASKNNSCQSIFIPRLMHLQETRPDILKLTTEPIFSLPEYLVYQLTGKAYTLLPNERYLSAYWSNKSLKEFGLEEVITQDLVNKKLPPFQLLTESAGTLTEKAAKQLGITQKTTKRYSDIPVFCSGPDFITALLGTANIVPGRICDRAGTSEGINLCTKIPLTHKTIRTLPSPINPLWNISCMIPDSGVRFSNQKRNTHPDMSYQEYVHYLLQHQNTFDYTLMNNIAKEIKTNFDFLETTAKKNNMPFGKIVCTGGQSKNPEWMQFKSNILGRPLYVPACKDSELIGCAVVAFTALGYYSSMQEATKHLVKIGNIYNPQ